MIRVSPGYTVATFPIYSKRNNRIFAQRVEVRNPHNGTTATLWTGPSVMSAWDTAERHIAAVEAARQEVAA